MEAKNKIFCAQVHGYIEDALNAIKNSIIYTHITLGNHVVSDKNPIVAKYFSKITENSYAANNGWMMGVHDARNNFADCDQFYYLRR